MPTYMTSFIYNGEGWQKLAKHPEDRSVPVKALMEKLGGRLISMYYMAGDHDGFIIYEAPDAKVAATAVVADNRPRPLDRSLSSAKPTKLHVARCLR